MRHTPIVSFDHVSLPVRRFAAARKFYVEALGALGMKINMDVGEAFGMGSKNQKVFWVSKSPRATGESHIAFSVDHREEVDAFYDAALRAGGDDNGAPGPRPGYGPHYYATFVHDPEGNNIEVVCYAKAPGKSAKKKSAKKKSAKSAKKKTARR